MLTIDDLKKEAGLRVNFGLPRRVSVTCSYCGKRYSGVIQYRYGQNAAYIDTGDDGLKPIYKCCRR